MNHSSVFLIIFVIGPRGLANNGTRIRCPRSLILRCDVKRLEALWSFRLFLLHVGLWSFMHLFVISGLKELFLRIYFKLLFIILMNRRQFDGELCVAYKWPFSVLVVSLLRLGLVDTLIVRTPRYTCVRVPTANIIYSIEVDFRNCT